VGKDVARLAERVTALVEQGLDVAEAYAAAKGSGTKATREHAKAMERHAKAVTRHQQRVHAARSRAVTMTAVSGGTAVLGVVDAATAATMDGGVIPGAPWWWLVASAVTAVIAVRSRHDALTATAPTAPALPSVSWPNDLRRDAVGYAEAQALSAVRRQLLTMVPAVASLHPDAGRELKSADDEAAPAFTAQVARLAARRPTPPARPGDLSPRPQEPQGISSLGVRQATDAAEQVRSRLAQGVAVYDKLLAAASTMLASPDLGRSALDVLGPAADALTAYADGLRTASDATGTTW
jgi:hypothetical protein